MKKLFFITTVSLICIFAFNACTGNKASKGSTTEQKQAMKTVYTCEMHPEVVSDNSGKCPKCGMELIKKEVPATDTTHMHHDEDSMKNMKGM